MLIQPLRSDAFRDRFYGHCELIPFEAKKSLIKRNLYVNGDFAKILVSFFLTFARIFRFDKPLSRNQFAKNIPVATAR